MCLQEPYMWKGRCLGLPYACTKFHKKADRCRAAIVAPRGVDLWYMDQYSTTDLAVCTLKGKHKSIIIASLYCDITKYIPQELQDLTQFCIQNNLDVIICADTNAHSTLWGSDSNNGRGDFFEDFLINTNLKVCNRGQSPTFLTCRAESIIDVTLASPNVSNLIKNWKVWEKLVFSDHRRIDFDLDLSIVKSKPTRNYRKIDWDLFNKEMESKTWFPPFNWDPKLLDYHTNKFEKDIWKVLDTHYPLRVFKSKGRLPDWWSEEIEKLRRETRNAHNNARNSQTEEDWAIYKTTHIRYNRLIRKSRREQWRDYCSEVQSVKDVSQLLKISKAEEKNTLGFVKRADGSFTTSAEETYQLLIDEHFPGNTQYQVTNTPQISLNVEMWGSCFLNEKVVKRSIDSFQPFKAPGPDGVPPIVLQNLGPAAIKRLTAIYIASLKLRYVPTRWKTSKVIFIPKPGKKTYNEVRSFRPISLMSFLFKALEKAVKWEIDRTVLQEQPLHPTQHGFRKGFSCDSALSTVIDTIESSLYRKQYTVGLFLDIQGAFDNVLPSRVIQSMEDRGVHPDQLGWYKNYLYSRAISVNTDIKHKIVRSAKKGTPQGGCLSDIAWNVNFDEVPALFDNSPITATMFADDGSLIAKGPDLPTLITLLQSAIHKVENWGRDNGLTFSQAKTIAVIFTRKYKIPKVDKLIINGGEVEYQNSAKYLGVTIDSKLNWNEHVESKIKKVKNLLFCIKGVASKTWGPSPKLMKWAYTGMIRPVMTHGAIVWAQAVAEKVTLQKKLEKLNRLACLSVSPVRKSTPTGGMEVIYDIAPLDIYIQQMGLMSYWRTRGHKYVKWDGIGLVNLKGHRRTWKQKVKEADIHPMPEDNLYFPEPLFAKYVVETDSYEEGLDNPEITARAYTIGTQKAGNSGYGYTIYGAKNLIEENSGYLGKHATIAQAELLAIEECSIAFFKMQIWEYADQVTIFSNSQGTLKTLEQWESQSKQLSSCYEMLNVLTRHVNVNLRYIKTSVKSFNCLKAKHMAQIGTQSTTIGCEPYLGLPAKFFKDKIKSWAHLTWMNRWSNRNDCRQTKLWFPITREQITDKIITFNRQKLGSLIQFFTGHAWTKRHQSLVDETESPLCRLCQEEDETPEHLVTECQAIVPHILALWNNSGEPQGTLNIIKPFTWELGRLLDFFIIVQELFIPPIE